MIVPVILCGGSGTRLWPMSRELYPKQFLRLVSERTMLQDTVSRLEGIDESQPPVFVCNEEHRFLVAEQVRELGVSPQSIVLEPEGRNTAPAVAVAALMLLESDPLLLVLPADHVIADPEGFQRAVGIGVEGAKKGKLVTFGIIPDKPETGYGYIHKGPALGHLGEDAGLELYLVDRFVEKPDKETARQYLRSGDYFWNSGMFLMRASKFLRELERFSPEILEQSRRALDGSEKDLDFHRLQKEAFLSSPSDSVDYAVLERTRDAAVVPMSAGWSDVGSWAALWEVGAKDAKGNAVKGDVLSRGVSNCYLHSESRLVAALGLKDTVVVETKDAVLVAARGEVQQVKELVNTLKGSKRDQVLTHRRVYRPWGSYEGMDQSERFQVKRLTVKPGEVLSLQKHYHRAEHWIVVRGTARVVKDEEEVLLSEDQSTYIPLGTVHRLENPGKITLELIEVQTGSYLGEDDIVRYEDLYGRSGN